MKHLTLFLPLLFTIMMSGCKQSDDVTMNVFVSNHGKPVMVYKSSDTLYRYGLHNYTLVAKDGEVLLLTDCLLVLPDTLK